MGTKKNPVVTKELLEWLEQLFPDRCPDAKASDRDVWIDAGSARVIRKLRKTYEDQMKSQLGG